MRTTLILFLAIGVLFAGLASIHYQEDLKAFRVDNFSALEQGVKEWRYGSLELSFSSPQSEARALIE